jgi:hypothetical protein
MNACIETIDIYEKRTPQDGFVILNLRKAVCVAGMLLLFAAVISQAATHYVDLNGSNPSSPYTNWATAAVLIQDAVDAAAAGDEVVVNDGSYASGSRLIGTNLLANRVVVDKAVTVRSVHGPSVTFIVGAKAAGGTNGNGAIRGVYLTSGAILDGFTVTNGATLAGGNNYGDLSGGGAFGGSAVLTNCVFVANSAYSSGGGTYGGTLFNCVLAGNSAEGDTELSHGGGANGSVLYYCILTNNSADAGGGAASYGPISGGNGLYNCTLGGNRALYDGGGAWNCWLFNCTLSGNSADVLNGGAGGGVYLSSLVLNCTLTGNSAYLGGGAFWCNLYSCTLTGNSANEGGGAAAGDSPFFPSPCWLYNCIIYFNDAPYGPDHNNTVVLHYCCTTELQPNDSENITNAPLFMGLASGDLRLQSNSPCINGGNNDYELNGVDFDGNPRIVGGMVDIGAYEFQSPRSSISYAWLQQYGLPTDGSADFTDPDGDGMNNWQEWIAGTSPVDATSVLRMLPLRPNNNSAGVLVSWQSLGFRTYFVQRSTNLSAQPAFSTIRGTMLGAAGTTTSTYLDTTATNAGPYFYRVGVQR